MYGIQAHEINWFADYLFNRRQAVTYDDQVSDEQPVTCRVPQGSILGPLLFLLYFNDFEDYLKYCEVVMFADETVLYYPNGKIEIIENALNEDLAAISNYFLQNELIINFKKNKNSSNAFRNRSKIIKSLCSKCIL